jgi:hypothetical protein
MREFKFYNPDIRDLNKPLPRGFWVTLPGEKTDVAGFIKRKLKKNRI